MKLRLLQQFPRRGLCILDDEGNIVAIAGSSAYARLLVLSVNHYLREKGNQVQGYRRDISVPEFETAVTGLTDKDRHYIQQFIEYANRDYFSKLPDGLHHEMVEAALKLYRELEHPKQLEPGDEVDI